MPTPLPTALSGRARWTSNTRLTDRTVNNEKTGCPVPGFCRPDSPSPLQLSTKEKSCSLTILILQTFTFSNSGWPIAQKKRRITGINGRKNGGKLRLAYGQLPATTDLKIDLQGAQTLFDMGCGPVPYRWRWRTNSRRFMALITVRDAERCRPSRRRAKGRQCPLDPARPKRTGVTCHAAILPWLPLHSGG